MKVAFVAPFYGPDAAGGAEAECRGTALHLAASGFDVEVLTTCLLDLQHDWDVHAYPAGVSRDGRVLVRRFKAERIDPGVLSDLNLRILGNERLSPEEERRFFAMHINSTALLRYLDEHADEYRRVCFIPYLFGTTHYGSRIVPHKAVLIPCLHDEPYARMAAVSDLFHRVEATVYHSKAEMKLAEELYGRRPGRQLLIGEGVETDFESDPARFRRRYGLEGPFLLYAGRKDATKNVPALLSYFLQYKQWSGDALELVMIGPGSVPVPAALRGAVHDLGFVPTQDKKDAYAAAEALCQPSLNESFSLVVMESWVCAVPCLVHADCAVTREHALRSGGGLYFGNGREFAACLRYLRGHPGTARRMGNAGARYVKDQFAWSRIVDRYRDEVFADSDH